MKTYKTYEEAFAKNICEVYANGTKHSSRTYEMYEILGYSYKVDDASSYQYKKNYGRIDYEYAKTFFEWLVAGSTPELTAKFIEKYPNVKGYLERPKSSNVPENFNAFYGPRICEQLPFVLEELKKENSRRAVISILKAEDNILYNANESTETEYPCCDSITFNIRDNKLYMHVHMRSQNFGQVAKLDNYLMGRLHEHIAKELHADVGYATWSIVSAHVFERDIQYFYESGILELNALAFIKFGNSIIDELKQKNIKLTLIRHAETEANRFRTLQGRTSTNIIEFKFNIETAKIIAKADILHSSMLPRTYDTIKHYDENAEIEQFSELNEISWGNVDGKINITDDVLMYMRTLQQYYDEPIFENAECLKDVYVRLIKYLLKLFDVQYENKNIVICTHGIIIASLISLCNNKLFDICNKPDFEQSIRLI